MNGAQRPALSSRFSAPPSLLVQWHFYFGRINGCDGWVTGTTHWRRMLSNKNTSFSASLQSLSASHNRFPHTVKAPDLLHALRLTAGLQRWHTFTQGSNSWHLNVGFWEVCRAMCNSSDNGCPTVIDCIQFGRMTKSRSGPEVSSCRITNIYLPSRTIFLKNKLQDAELRSTERVV